MVVFKYSCLVSSLFFIFWAYISSSPQVIGLNLQSGNFLSTIKNYGSDALIKSQVALLSILSFFSCYYLWSLVILNWSYLNCLSFPFLSISFWSDLMTWFNNSYLVFSIDLISLFLVILTNITMVVSYWYVLSIKPPKIAQLFYLLVLIHLFLIVAFTVKDSLFFYIFFEAILIPMFVIIGCWGSRDRRIKANYYFFLYTLFGSLFMLFGLMYLNVCFNSTSYDIFMLYTLPNDIQVILWPCFFIPFAVKTPMFPFHIWLPEAHVEAPTVGSVILAALLLKLGGYGFIRFTIPLFKYANMYFSPLICVMAILSVVYASVITIRQIDLKRIVAYSSVAHMNLAVLGLFSYTLQGIEGSIYLMIAHGFVSAALFFLIGIIYSRTHSRLINYYGGLAVIMPKFSFFFINLSLANMAFPGTANFIGEFLVMVGLAEKNTSILIFATLSIVFSAVYSIWLFNRVCFGSFKTMYFSKKLFWSLRLNATELSILSFLVFMTWLTGLSSDFILSFDLHATVLHLLLRSV